MHEMKPKTGFEFFTVADFVAVKYLYGRGIGFWNLNVLEIEFQAIF